MHSYNANFLNLLVNIHNVASFRLRWKEKTYNWLSHLFTLLLLDEDDWLRLIGFLSQKRILPIALHTDEESFPNFTTTIKSTQEPKCNRVIPAKFIKSMSSQKFEILEIFTIYSLIEDRKFQRFQPHSSSGSMFMAILRIFPAEFEDKVWFGANFRVPWKVRKLKYKYWFWGNKNKSPICH